MNEIINDAIVHFIIGSSPVITIFIYTIMLHNYYTLTLEEKQEVESDLVLLLFLIPILYGFSMAMLYICLGVIPRKTSNSIYLRFIMSGALSSVIVSLLCFYFIPSYSILMRIDDVSMFHVFVFVFYLVLFYTIGQWIRAQLIYGPTPSKTSTHSVSNDIPLSSVNLPSSQSSSQGPLYHSPLRNNNVSLKTFEQIKKMNEVKK